MSEQDDVNHAIASAQGYLQEARGEKASIVVVVTRLGGKSKMIIVGHDSASLLAEVNKVARFLERAIDVADGMENQAGSFTWLPN